LTLNKKINKMTIPLSSSFSRKTCLVYTFVMVCDIFILVSPALAFSSAPLSQPWAVGKTTRLSSLEYQRGLNPAYLAWCSMSPIQSGTVLSATGHEQEVSKKKKRLPRAERKALERSKKGTDGRGEKKNISTNNPQKKKRYNLNSNHISELTLKSTADDVLKAIKRAQNLHDNHDILNIERFLLEEVDVSFAFGYRGSLLARLAVAALHLSNHELARKAIEERRLNHRSAMLPMESSGIIRGMLRVHNVTDAISMLND